MSAIPRFSYLERPSIRENLQDGIYDVAVIGGGITGAGVARDAALRGLKVALVEANDFASGTSSGSTKLLHGGLRYLEMFDFKLVFDAIQEREKLKTLYAPFVKELDFVFPTYAGLPPPRWKLNLGLHLYDSFSFFRERHQNLNSSEAKAAFPYLKASGLTGACVYSDSFAEDYRLVIELVKSAHQYGATCISRMRATQVQRTANSDLLKITLHDEFEQGKTVSLQCRSVIHCGGPFADELRQKMGLRKILKLTQGVHFLISKSRLPIDKAFVFADPALHRILFAIPWNSTFYIGTTDSSIARAEDARATPGDLDYVLRIVNNYFSIQLKPSDVIQSWAAVRPLLQPDEQVSNSQISREHVILEEPERVFHVLGGKLTSHRLMAEEAVDLLKKYFPKMGDSTTSKAPLYPNLHSQVLPEDFAEKVRFSLDYEMVLNPIDFMRRRSALYYESPTLETAEKISAIFRQTHEQHSQAPLQTDIEATKASLQWDQKGFVA